MSSIIQDLDIIISRLTLVDRNNSSFTKEVKLKEKEIRYLCYASRAIFLDQPMLLEIRAPMHICGDLHGQFADLLRYFDYGGYPAESQYLFLGDYVDRGRQSIETICLLLALKIKHPNSIYLLRGNHECSGISRIYGFYDECKRRYNTKMWKTFTDCFNCLPVAAIIDDRMFCCHGGLSPSLHSMDQILEIARPVSVPDSGLLCDLLWSDPAEDVEGWAQNIRGVSYVFGELVVIEFIRKFDFDVIVRAHQMKDSGHEFFAGRRLVTIFSAPNYCEEFENAGAMMIVDSNLACSFHTLEPRILKRSIIHPPDLV